tara:strand:+ start:147 stop:446 length:300 start_codon:yes stop_codon:yes gene_type:complete
MAAKASRVIEGLQGKLAEMAHAFTYAPGMDAPYLDFDTWGNAYNYIRNLKDELDALHAYAVTAETQLDGGTRYFTAEQYRDAWLNERWGPPALRSKQLA